MFVLPDSLDDSQNLMDLRKKAKYYKLTNTVRVAFDPVPILTTPMHGDLSVPAIVKQLKIWQSAKGMK